MFKNFLVLIKLVYFSIFFTLFCFLVEWFCSTNVSLINAIFTNYYVWHMLKQDYTIIPVQLSSVHKTLCPHVNKRKKYISLMQNNVLRICLFLVFCFGLNYLFYSSPSNKSRLLPEWVFSLGTSTLFVLYMHAYIHRMHRVLG